MLRRGGLFLRGGEVDIHRLTDLEPRQNFILCGVVVVFCPARLKDNRALQHEFLKVTDLDLYLALFGDTVLGTEYRNEAAKHGGINLPFLLGECVLRRDFIGGGQCGVRLNFRVIEDVLRVLEADGVAKL